MINTSSFKTRFAPSPTGYLHLGHAASALKIWEQAKQIPENFLVRIEDIDQTRCLSEYERAILEDLDWLGIKWSTPPRRQSEHFEDYKKLLNFLQSKELLYPCFCTRKDIEQEIANSPSAPHSSPAHLYPGTCSHISKDQRKELIEKGTPFALRLNMKNAIEEISGKILTWTDLTKGDQKTTAEMLMKNHGDIVLARKDTPASYHLCVTHDDALQDITHITRGDDLFESTHIHRLLQELLGYPTPQYNHHPLTTDKSGRRLAKRDKSLTIREIRKRGISANDLKNMILHSNIDQLLI